jgi:hypothetical protein
MSAADRFPYDVVCVRASERDGSMIRDDRPGDDDHSAVNAEKPSPTGGFDLDRRYKLTRVCVAYFG